MKKLKNLIVHHQSMMHIFSWFYFQSFYWYTVVTMTIFNKKKIHVNLSSYLLQTNHYIYQHFEKCSSETTWFSLLNKFQCSNWVWKMVREFVISLNASEMFLNRPIMVASTVRKILIGSVHIPIYITETKHLVTNTDFIKT